MKKLLLALIVITLVFSMISAGAATRYGDLDGDGSIDSLDVTILKRGILKKLTIEDPVAADLDGDGEITSLDLTLLKRYVLKKISGFPVEISNPTVTPTSTPIITPSPTQIDEEAWKNNTGTINLGDMITFTGEGISVSGSVVSITKGGDHEVTGTLNNGMIYIKTKERVKLRLSGVNIKNNNGPAIYFDDADKAFITITEDTVNYLEDGTSYSDKDAKAALFSNDTLEIKGKGTLNIKGNYKHGIASDDKIIIENGNINITAASDGLHANDSIRIDKGKIDITANSDGIDCEGDIEINGGTLKIKADGDGIKSELDLVINDGKINISKSTEGIESKAAMIVNGGEINLTASEDGINVANSFTINGGTIYTTGGTDGLDSNGPINIAGGYIVAVGGDIPEGGIDCDRNALSITGGTLIAIGGSNSSPTANLCTQCVVLLGRATANSVIRIEKDGKEILNFTVPRAYQNMVFSSPDLELNSNYVVYINGNQILTFTTNSIVTNAGTGGGPGGGWFPR